MRLVQLRGDIERESARESMSVVGNARESLPPPLPSVDVGVEVALPAIAVQRAEVGADEWVMDTSLNNSRASVIGHES